MDILEFDGPLDETLSQPVLLFAFDGWTDAGRAGSMAAEHLRTAWYGHRIASFDPDALFDYRDRRPMLTIDAGVLRSLEWPSLDVHHLTSPEGVETLLVQGSEPDISWRTLCADVVELARLVGSTRYFGLGAVPGPVPHTRPTRVSVTASREDLVEDLGLPHERLVVPASCQAVVEAQLREAGLTTLGMWARVPHYVAGDYPEGAVELLRKLSLHLGVDFDLASLEGEAAEHRKRLDAAAESSPEITEHIEQLEASYDTDVDTGFTGELPTGDEIAAELQRYLREQGNGE